MRDDILKLLAGRKNLTHIFITTFNIDFIFIENVLLRELRKCGHPSLTIFADADEVVATFASQGRWVSRIGRRYRVIPIRMEPGFRFHPKMVMLSGTEQADLFVGSGNLTYGGMRQNDEIWLQYQSNQDGTGPLVAFKEIGESCLTRANHPVSARKELCDAFDPDQHEWARAMEPISSVLAKVGVGPSLLHRMFDVVGDLDVQRIVVGSPYFDDDGEALTSIAKHWPGVLIEVMVQPGQSQLLESAWKQVREPKSLVTIATSRGKDTQAFIHAKFYAFIGVSEAVLCVGSANCSRAALILPESAGNAEALAVIKMKPDEVEKVLASGLSRIDEPVVLRTSLPPVSLPEPSPPIRILAASHDHGELMVTYTALKSIHSIELLTDGHVLSENDITVSDGLVRVRSIGVINRVQLAAIVDGKRYVSAEHWVDHEFMLNSTSRQRQVAQAIGDHISPSKWSFHGWTEVLRLLGDHLTHTPATSVNHKSKELDEKKAPASVAYSDFFTEDYRIPAHRREICRLDETSRVLGLRGLLLDYFGISNDEAIEPEIEEDDSDEETVDRPETAKTKQENEQQTKITHDLTKSERRRGRQITKQIVDICTSQQFVETRPASMLSSDLAIIAVLLVSGHAEGWLESDDFLDLTYRVWSFLFFDDMANKYDKGRNTGALERRHNSSPDPLQYEKAIQSARLAASLTTWCFSCPQGISRAEATRFEVATRLAVARLPWLWHSESPEKFEMKLFEIAQRTGWLGPDIAQQWEQILTRCNDLFAESQAIAILESMLIEIGLPTIKELITDDELPEGTLLWQGANLGFCALGQTARRQMPKERMAKILTLRSQEREKNLSCPYLLPFRSLLRLAGDYDQSRFTHAHIHALEAFATRIETMWSAICHAKVL
ncbi:MAG: hypothetical protein CMJ19_19170 [Phycisphaeraceae bacterium]|nr:hypothetical protein [Phycisphaeraceae bacterium]